MILRGEALEQLAGLSAGSVQMCLSSPPYWGLRSYLPDAHPDKPKELGLEPHHDCLGWTTGKQCGACYVCQLVEVFSRVREILTEDGTLWLNIGDSYTSGGRQDRNPGKRTGHPAYEDGRFAVGLRPPTPIGLKPKDLVGVPWRVAFALQADGWWLRSDIIWHKPNCMPESVKVCGSALCHLSTGARVDLYPRRLARGRCGARSLLRQRHDGRGRGTAGPPMDRHRA